MNIPFAVEDSKFVRVLFKGEVLFGFSDGFQFVYFKDGKQHMAYGFHPGYPDLPHFTDLRETTVIELLKEMSLHRGADTHVAPSSA